MSNFLRWLTIFRKECKSLFTSPTHFLSILLPLLLAGGAMVFMMYKVSPIFKVQPDFFQLFLEKQISIMFLCIAFCCILPIEQVNVVRERTSGLFATLMTTPLTFKQYIMGKSVFYFLVGYTAGLAITASCLGMMVYTTGLDALWNVLTMKHYLALFVLIPIALFEGIYFSVFALYYFKNPALVFQSLFFSVFILMFLSSSITSAAFFDICLKVLAGVIVASLPVYWWVQSRIRLDRIFSR
ncbi:MAG: hypothetical protein Q4D38_03330 [Planctomycetia bacterium]|nr:hypothetical protein [Planctomycetia bacterium]